MRIMTMIFLSLFLSVLTTNSDAQNENRDCENLNVDFDYTISGNTVVFTGKGDVNLIVRWFWNFGNGKSGDGSQITHTYANPGEYEVCLKVAAIASNSSAPCTKTICKKILVAPANDDNDCGIVANFEFTIDGTRVRFEAKSNKDNSLFFWSFQPANTAGGQASITHDFQSPGEYEVCLRVIIPGTECKKTICKKIIIRDVDIDCNLEADFEYRIEGTKGIFKAISNINNVVFRWSFASNTASGNQNPAVFDFREPGEYEVCLTAFLPDTDCRVVVCKKIIIGADNECGLVADFDFEVDGTKVRFKAKSNRDNTLFFWSFSSINTSANQQTVVHDFQKPGVYEVCLTAFIPNTPCRVRICKKVEIKEENNCELKADFEIFLIGNTVRVHGKSNQNNADFKWEFGNGQTGTGQWASVTYSQPGVYVICLHVSVPNSDCVVRVCKRVRIENPDNNDCKLVAAFRFFISGTQVKFAAHVFGPAIITPSSQYQFSWDFGDGNKGEGREAAHNYSDPGEYRVCLTVTDTRTGCSVTVCQTVVVGRNLQMEDSDEQVKFDVKLVNHNHYGEFSFSANKELKNIEVYDMYGQRMEIQRISGTEHRTNAINWRSGVYFARFESITGEVYVVKFNKFGF